MHMGNEIDSINLKLEFEVTVTIIQLQNSLILRHALREFFFFWEQLIS